MIEWKRIKGVWAHEDGTVSVVGHTHRIRKIPARHSTDKYGYYFSLDMVNPENGKWTSFYLHRIVCECYHEIDSPSKYEVNHKNLDKLDNRPENLEWTTKSENRKHAYSTGANPIALKLGDKNGRAKLDWVSVGIIREAIAKGYSTIHIAKYFNVSQSLISCIKLNKNWVIQ